MVTRASVFLILTISCFAGSAYADLYQGVIAEVQPNHETHDCFYFRLEGVMTIVPPSAGGWFAISRNQLGAKDAYAAILAARIAGVPIRVITGANSICGHAQAVYVSL